MVDTCRITVLSENIAHDDGLKPEYGLSLWIEVDGVKILFDTGQSDNFARNAERINVPLEQADFLVVSHGHFDHTGGIAHALTKCPDVRIYLHPDALVTRYIRLAPNSVLQIGMPDPSRKALEAKHAQCRWTGKPTRISEHAFITGPVPRETDFETIGEDFWLDENCSTPDHIHDDQSLWLETSKGLVVILGCAHAGVVNTIEFMRRLSGIHTVRAVVGGMHLMNSSTGRIDATAQALENLGIGLLAPCHCTGEVATEHLRKHHAEVFQPCGTGSILSFDL